LAPKASKLPVSFAPSANAADLQRVGRPGSGVVFTLKGAANRPGVVDGSAVTYSDVSPAVDLEYRVASTVVKTTVIVKSAAGVGEGVWRFPMTLDSGLTPKLNGTGGVDVVDAEGVVVGQVPTPLMWDSKANAQSGDPGVYGPLVVRLEGDANVGWTLALVADTVWMRGKDRVFPIHVDPTYYVIQAGVQDAYIRDNAATTNYNVVWNSTYGYYENRVGYYDSSTGNNAGLLQFDTSVLAGAQIYGAYARAYIFHAYYVSTPTVMYLRKVTSSWSAGSVTWNTGPSSSAETSTSVARGQWSDVDVTSLTQQWASGTAPNYGLKYTTDTGTQSQWKRMASTENPSTSAPYLYVLYNHDAGMAQPVAPGNGAAVHAPESTGGVSLSATATDPNGDPFYYYFRVSTGADGESNVVWNSGWVSQSQVTVPAAAVPAGRTYYWHVYTYDFISANNTVPNWVRSFTVTNTAPPQPSLTTPATGTVLGALTPTLTWPTVTDADGDTVKYWVKVATGADGASGQVVSSGWLTAPASGPMSWTVPAGVLRDGVPYTWTVTTGDSRWTWVSSPPPGGTVASQSVSAVGKFKVDLRLGLGKTVPSDDVGGVNVNLFNGNAVVSAGSPSIMTVGGPVGVSFTYNSRKPRQQGLTGVYYDGDATATTFPAGKTPVLTRLDSQVSFDWGAESPFAPAMGVDYFGVQWNGFVQVPTTGSWEFGADRDNGARIWVGTTQVLNKWENTVGVDFGSAVSLSAGTWVPIKVDFYETWGLAKIKLMVRPAGGAGFEVPASWLSPAPEALPDGWALSADLDGSGGYQGALISDASVVLTDSSGTTHTYTKKSDGSYVPPTGEQGILAKDATGTLMLTDEGGTITRFDSTGAVTAVQSPADDRKPAAAVYTYSGTPSRLSTITDPLSGRVITLKYNRDNFSCPTGAGYDTTPPAAMLCQVVYPGGSTTDLAYQNGQLARIMDPGTEVTQFAYTNGVLTGYRTPLVMDWVAKDPTNRAPSAGSWSVITYDSTTLNTTSKVLRVQSPEPTGFVATPSGRVGHTYTYDTTNAAVPKATVTVDNASGLVTTFEMDATGRPTKVTNPQSQVSTIGWSAKDLPLWSTDHKGMTTVTAYDPLDRPTDSWGPYRDGCFTTTTVNGVTTKEPMPACTSSIPHTSTSYDAGITGLDTAWWTNTTMTGPPAMHSTTVPSGTAVSGLGVSSGFASRHTGILTLPPGTYTFTAHLGTASDDGVRLFLDDQPVLSRWDSYDQAVTAPINVSDKPTGYWRLGEASGTTAADSSGNAKTATYAGGPTLGQPDALALDTNTAAAFPGASLMQLPPTVVSTDTFTMEAWVKPTGTITLNDPSDTNTAGTSGQRWLFFPTQGGNDAGAGVSVGTNGISVYEHGNGYLAARATYAASLGTAWHHVAVTYTNRVATIYLDGQPVDASTTSPRPHVTSSLAVGTGTYGDYEGHIDEVAVYSTALDTARIAGHYAAGFDTTTSVASGTGINADGKFTLDGAPHRIRVDYKNPTGAGSVTLKATNASNVVTTITGAQLSPNYGLVTGTTTDDDGGVTPSITTTANYSDATAGIEPALGLPTSSTVVVPGGTDLVTKTTYEAYNPGSLLRRTGRTLPSGAATTITTQYYGGTDTVTTTCPGNDPSLIQSGLPKIITQATPAAGPVVATEAIYDTWGRVVASGYRANGTGTPANWTCTTYDTRGRVTKVTIPPNSATPSSPERTIETSYADLVTGDPLVTVVREKDTNGAVTSINQMVTDLLGRTVTYSHTVPGSTPTTVLATITTTTQYDTAGRAYSSTTSSSTGGSSTIAQTYLTDGRTSTITVGGVTVATLTYDSVDKDLSKVTYASGSGVSLETITRSPDTNAVMSQTWKLPAGQTLTDTVTRSRTGRIKTATTTDNTHPTTPDNWTYTYDAASRLTQAVLAAAGTRSSLTLGYLYAASSGCGADPAAGLNGSRTGSTRQVGTGTTATSTYCTDNASRLTSVSSSPTGLSILPAAITYDGHGNATQIGTQSWTYDGADRVTSATASGITPSSAVYVRDSLGRVIVSGPVAVPVRYGFTGADDSPDFQLTTTGGLGERYVSLPGGALLTVNGTTTTWSIPNLHGDIIATVTGTNVTAGFLYDPYGQPLDKTSLEVTPGAVPATRTGTTSDAWHGGAQRGYEHGGGLNQILMGARSYLPELGIFTATDPIEGGNTTTYAYPQDPINAEDLTGTRFTIKAMKYFSEFGGLAKMNAAGPFGFDGGGGGGLRSNAKAGAFARNQIGISVNRRNLLVDFEVGVSTSLGRRVIDVLVSNRNGGLRALESKVGRVSNSSRVRAQIRKDAALIEMGYSVTWVFSRSSVTGLKGPTREVRKQLVAAGIDIVER